MTRILPRAEVQHPACGACFRETWNNGDALVCDDCQLRFNPVHLEASYLDEDAEPCGKPCTNDWHGPHLIKNGYGYECSPCTLPDTHKTGGLSHWCPCRMIQIPAPSKEQNR